MRVPHQRRIDIADNHVGDGPARPSEFRVNRRLRREVFQPRVNLPRRQTPLAVIGQAASVVPG